VKPAQHPTAQRTSQLLRAAGIDSEAVEFEAPTRTSAEAAAAIGCSVAEIAKSIVSDPGHRLDRNDSQLPSSTLLGAAIFTVATAQP
jgi:hypothetical protein